MGARAQTITLLQAAFSEAEWQYLSEHGAFIYQLSRDDGSQTSYENLIEIGTLLLRQRENVSPHIPWPNNLN